MNYLTLPDATELLKQIQSGERSAEGVVSEYLQRLETQHPRINAAVQVFRDQGPDEARSPRPCPLSGLPISVKETFGLAGGNSHGWLFADAPHPSQARRHDCAPPSRGGSNYYSPQ